MRDSGLERVALLLADTRHNRGLLARYGPDLRANFPISNAVGLASLGRGADPGGNALLVL